ncbi:hypothetical protein [Aeromonas sp. CU5]|uniref:hypothetical protein n=1 Tax=Aeromonas sp. CU5 TaxID=2033033 RepID=UPI0012FD2AF1|nr:hypothetical protein [Aeromonas sp. CU5]
MKKNVFIVSFFISASLQAESFEGLETITLPVITPYFSKYLKKIGDTPYVDYILAFSSDSDYNIRIQNDMVGRSAFLAMINASQSHQDSQDFFLKVQKQIGEWSFYPVSVQFDRTSDVMPLMNISPAIDGSVITSYENLARVLNVGCHIKNKSEPKIENTCGVKLKMRNGAEKWFLLPIDTHPQYASLVNVAVGMLSVPSAYSYFEYYTPSGSDYPVLMHLSGGYDPDPGH